MIGEVSVGVSRVFILIITSFIFSSKAMIFMDSLNLPFYRLIANMHCCRSEQSPEKNREMGKGSHGGGIAGAFHSHDTEYPDDNW